MQRFIKYALPLACFAIITWCCFFGGFDYIDWKWIVVAVVIGAIAFATLYIKRRKLLVKRDKLRNQLERQVEEAIAPELEKVKGNWLKKEMVKCRLKREYLEKSPEYAECNDNHAIDGLQGWLYSLGGSIYWLCVPLLGVIIWGIVAIALILLFSWSFPNEMAICCVISVVASVLLVWRRNYVLAPIAIGLAAILLYGIFNAGLNGVEMPAFHMVVENEGNIFLNPSHAEEVMWGSIVILCIISIGLALYPLLKKKTLVICAILVLIVVDVTRYTSHFYIGTTIPIPTSYMYYPYVLSCAINADLAVMLGISYNAAFVVLFVYLAWLFTAICSLPAFIRSWRGMSGLKEHSPLSTKTRCKRLYRVCLTWLIMNALATALIWGQFIGISMDECASILVKGTQNLSEILGIGYFAANFIVYCAPILISAFFSWILFAITRRQIK